MKQFLFLLIFLSFMTNLEAQNTELPYAQIPEPTETYTAGTTVSRMLDGLGFRYYWATEGLRPEDLAYRPGGLSRSTEETLDHILGLTQVIVNSALGVPNGEPQPKMTFEEKRNLTLENIKASSDKLKNSSPEDLAKYDMIFSSGGQFPFWNLLNGPIADAINHVGQIISFRRTNGNPYNQNISVLRGKVTN